MGSWRGVKSIEEIGKTELFEIGTGRYEVDKLHIGKITAARREREAA